MCHVRAGVPKAANRAKPDDRDPISPTVLWILPAIFSVISGLRAARARTVRGPRRNSRLWMQRFAGPAGLKAGQDSSFRPARSPSRHAASGETRKTAANRQEMAFRRLTRIRPQRRSGGCRGHAGAQPSCPWRNGSRSRRDPGRTPRSSKASGYLLVRRSWQSRAGLRRGRSARPAEPAGPRTAHRPRP